MKATTKTIASKLAADTKAAFLLPASLVAETSDTFRIFRGAENALESLGQHYYNAGVRVRMLEGKGKGSKGAKLAEYQPLHDQIKAAIIDSYDDDVKALIAKEPKTLGKIEAGLRTYWLSNMTSAYFGKVRTHVAAIEARGGKPKVKVSTTFYGRLNKSFLAMYENLGKQKEPEFDVAGFIKEHKALVAKYQIPKM